MNTEMTENKCRAGFHPRPKAFYNINFREDFHVLA